jgi:FMN phosphatase YigB (HAD superfamily)
MPPAVKALFFDVFGTLVDWRTSIAREAKTMLEPRGHALDWAAFADACRVFVSTRWTRTIAASSTWRGTGLTLGPT